MLVSIVLVLGALLVCWLYSRRRSIWSELGIPEVPGLPIVGNLFPVIARRQSYFQFQDDMYNSAPGQPYVGTYQLFRPFLVVRDPVLLAAMIRDDSRNFEDHGLLADPSDPLSLNLFYLKGKQWKSIRSKLRPTFSTSGMKNVYSDVQRCVDDFLEHFEGRINLRPTMDDFTSEVLAKAVFSVDSKEGFVDAANEVFSLTGFSAIRVLFRIFFPEAALKCGVKIVSQRVEDFFRNALTTSVRRPGSFLDLMFQLKDQDPDFNDDVMLGQFFIFILAGFETTATALTFCLYLLAKHPHVQEKARKEIEDIMSKYGPCYESHKEMVYLDYIINESLRLYTPVPSMARVSEQSYKLPCGAVLPAGTRVVIPFLSLHRDPTYFEQPMDFIPERWVSADKPAFFYPFGLGPRNCLGMQFALLEMKAFLSTFLFTSSVQLDPSNIEPLEFETNSFFIHTKHPIYVNVESRPL